MNRYQSSMPRAAMMFAAVAMTLLTLCLAVVAPAKMEPGSYDARTLAGTPAATSAPTEAILTPSRIEVFGAREENTAYEPVRHNAPKRKHES